MSSAAATPLSAAQLLAALEAASPEELAAICTKLSVASKPSKSAAAGGGGGVGRPKKEAIPLPESEDGDAPPESAYRVAEADIQDGVCDGRRLTDPDRRWKPAIYGERQCGGTIKDDGLCATCLRRREKFASDPSPKVDWHGRLTDDPMDWAHMLGTTWAEKANPVWGAGSAAGSEVAGAPAAAAAASAAASKAEKAAQKEAEKAAKAAAKELEKAQKAAAKEAEKAAKAAAKEAEKKAKEEAKAAEKAKKEAEKAAAAAAKKPAAAAAKKAATPAAAAAPAAVPAKADTSASAAKAELELYFDSASGDTWAIKDGLVHEYCAMTEKVGKVLGRAIRTGEDVTVEPLPAEGEASSASEADSGDLAL